MALPAFLAPITEAPRAQKIVFGVIGLAAIGAAAWFLLLSPLQTRVGMLTRQNDAVQKERLQVRAIAADVARFRRRPPNPLRKAGTSLAGPGAYLCDHVMLICVHAYHHEPER